MDDVATESELKDAVETIAVAAGHASTVDAAIESAQEAREAAEDLAEDLAEAAMESARGERITALEKELASWPEKLATALNSLRTEFQTMVEAVKATAQPIAPAAAGPTPAEIAATAAAAAAATSSGQPSTAQATETATVTVDPAATNPAAAGAAPEVQPVAKRKPKFL